MRPASLEATGWRQSQVDPWIEAITTDLSDLAGVERACWESVLEHAARLRRPRPSRRFLARVDTLAEAIGEEAFRARLLDWLERTARIQPTDQWPTIPPATGDILRGLAWACSRFGDEEVARVLAELALAAFRRTPGVGPRSVKVGNACALVLAQLPGDVGVAQLLRLRATVYAPSARRFLDAALEEVSRRHGAAPAEVEERAVPDYGLAPDGVASHRVDGYVAEMRVPDPATVELLWRRPDGRTQRASPAALRRSQPTAVERVEGAARDARAMLGAQRRRLERFFLVEPQWQLPEWRQRYHDHGLLATLTRRLIWVFRSAEASHAGLWWDGRFVDRSGQPLREPGANASVALWHPVHAAPDERRDWRRLLERLQVTQPFKQAHREVFEPVEGEELEEPFTNRYAGWRLRQGQLTALCRSRGWRYVPQPAWGSRDPPRLPIVERDLEAVLQLFVPEGPVAGDAPFHEWVTSGAVSFRRTDGAPVPLAEVPRAVFSEALRDVDLFVSVAGRDPAGQPPGGAQLETRREVLRTVLPKLPVKAESELADASLLLQRGSDRYKLDLATGDAASVPDGRPVHIPPELLAQAARRGERMLPFLGDDTLSRIVAESLVIGG